MSRYIVSVDFTGRNQRIRLAQQIFEQWKALPDVDQPEIPMTNSNVLTEALLCLGRSVAPDVETSDSEAAVLAAIHELAEQIQEQFGSINARINALAKTGIITHEQAIQINQAIDNDTQRFAANMAASIKGQGRR